MFSSQTEQQVVVQKPNVVPPHPMQTSERSQGGSTGAQPGFPKNGHTAKTPANPLEALAMLATAEDMRRKTRKAPSPPVPGPPTPPQAAGTTHTIRGGNDESSAFTHNDVLCGRGGLTNHHPGNVHFRRLVRWYQADYLRATKREKAGVAREIVDLIQGLEPPGRFLKRVAKNPSVWEDIGDKKAREKTSQALREGAPELREEMQSRVPVADKTVPPVAMVKPQAKMPIMGVRATLSASGHPVPLMGATAPPGQFYPSIHQAGQMPPTQEAMQSNRARIVSDDNAVGVMGIRPLFHQLDAPPAGAPSHFPAYMMAPRQPMTRPRPAFNTYDHALHNYARKQLKISAPPAPVPVPVVMPAPAESSGQKRKAESQVPSKTASAGAPKGPRLKLLKSRLSTDFLKETS